MADGKFSFSELCTITLAEYLARRLALLGSFDYGFASHPRGRISAQDDTAGTARLFPHPMDIADWRKRIDRVDRQLVKLLSERARAAVEIGRLKRDTNLPIYEPDRERIVLENVQATNRGPLPGRDLVRIFERIMDVMRNIQKEGIRDEDATRGTEIDVDVKD